MTICQDSCRPHSNDALEKIIDCYVNCQQVPMAPPSDVLDFTNAKFNQCLADYLPICPAWDNDCTNEFTTLTERIITGTSNNCVKC